jgi:ATP-dependent DNA helicase RecG
MGKRTNILKSFNARPYMELAIAEMNKSLNEPRPDGKVPPKVGAVLVFSNGRVEMAHRGELREGDHAEYTLLERKLGHEKLDDCILFTTLEPCVERNHPKIACCKRTSNARIKTVYVGITDPDATVDGKGVLHLEKHGVKVVMFDRDLQKIIEDENKAFRKQALQRKNNKEHEELLSPLEKPLPAYSISQFSDEALSKFIREAKLPYKLGSQELQDFLLEIGVTCKDEKNQKVCPTSLGVLLFGKNPRALLKQAALMAHVQYDKNSIEPVTFDQPLVLIPDLLERWLLKALYIAKNTAKFKREDVPDFPIDVLREAVINALVHRDYTIEGAKCAIDIDKDKIVVKSPGAPLPSITLDQLNTFKAPSISRNPIIAYVFSLMDYVEEKGFGMKALHELNEKYQLPLPEYVMQGPILTLTFSRSIAAKRKVSGNRALEGLTDEELIGLDWIKTQDKVTAKAYADHFEFNSKKAQRQLAKMQDNNLVVLEGRGPAALYSIKDMKRRKEHE